MKLEQIRLQPVTHGGYPVRFGIHQQGDNLHEGRHPATHHSRVLQCNKARAGRHHDQTHGIHTRVNCSSQIFLTGKSADLDSCTGHEAGTRLSGNQGNGIAGRSNSAG